MTQSGHGLPQAPDLSVLVWAGTMPLSSAPGEAMRRRELITFLCGAAATWPLAARAQQQTIPVVGFLSPGSPGPLRPQIVAFEEGLKQSGYIKGRNVAVEARFGEGQFDQLPALASDLVRRQVAVLVVTSNAGALAAKQATTTIPIVFSIGS